MMLLYSIFPLNFMQNVDGSGVQLTSDQNITTYSGWNIAISQASRDIRSF
jgi:hypothetical protein